jgi:PIN domain nuclease of toxin-antitoxin system
MIILDAHIWVWWVQADPRLTQQHQQWLRYYQSQGLGVSLFSCWEVAKLVENQRLILPLSINHWLDAALAYPGVQCLNLTLPIVVESTQLIGFHRDPADQIIVATARVFDAPLLTADQKILDYAHVQTLK